MIQTFAGAVDARRVAVSTATLEATVHVDTLTLTTHTAAATQLAAVLLTQTLVHVYTRTHRRTSLTPHAYRPHTRTQTDLTDTACLQTTHTHTNGPH